MPTSSSRRTTSARSEYRWTPAAKKPVFVGIARTSDVESYLSGVSYTTLTDVESTPFDADYDDHAGSAARSHPPTPTSGPHPSMARASRP